MSIEAIQVLSDEIGILQRLSEKALKKKSPLTKSCADKIRDVEMEITRLLSNAGVFDEHSALLEKKRKLRDELDSVIAQIDSQVEQAQNIALYLNSRVEALRAELKASQEG